MQVGDVCVVEGVEVGTVTMAEWLAAGEELSAKLLQNPTACGVALARQLSCSGKGAIERLRRTGGFVVVLDTGKVCVDPPWHRNGHGQVVLGTAKPPRKRRCCG